MSRKKEMILLAILILIGAAVRIHLLATSPNLFSVEAESYSKIQVMQQWEASPLLYPDINFGPFHSVFLYVPWKLTGSLVLGNRIVSVLLGILLLPIFYFLARRLYETPQALGALAFFTLCSLPVKVSVVTLAEGPTLFFFMLGLYLITRFAEDHRAPWSFLVFSGISFAAMTALRFETWMFLPILPLWLWWKRGFVPAVVFGAIMAVFPAFHMYICYIKTGDPLAFMHQSAAITAMNSALVPLKDRVLGFIISLGVSVSWGALALGAIGLVMAFFKRKGILTALLLLAVLAMYEYKSIQATLAFDLLRYLTIPAALIALLWVSPFESIGKKRRMRKSLIPALVMIVLGLGLGAWSYRTVLTEGKSLEYNQPAFDMLKGFKKSVKPGDRVFMGNTFHPIIVVESNLPSEAFQLPHYPDHEHASYESCVEIFSKWDPTVILVFEQDPLFFKTLAMSEPCSSEPVTLFDKSYCRDGVVGKWCWLKKCEGQTP